MKKINHKRRKREALFAFFALCAGQYASAQTAQDFGDAPEPYPTKAQANGARHSLLQGYSLGRFIDVESDGQPDANATGDDLQTSPTVPDDEDGVTFTSAIVPGQSATVEVVFTGAGPDTPGFLDAWIDFDQNGSWNEASDRIANALALVSGTNKLTFNVPQSTKAGSTYARFRLSRKGKLEPIGISSDGEVEDYRVVVESGNLDYGDAPDKYPVLASQNGARHTLSRTVFLGKTVDAESNGQPSANADFDDLSPLGAVDDEDGVTFLSTISPGATVRVEVVASVAGRLDAWLDFDGNGTWALGEQIFNSVALTAGSNSLSFSAPPFVANGFTFARFRFSLEGGLAVTGVASNGEVEDYRVQIGSSAALDFGDAPPKFPTLTAENGARHTMVEGFSLGAREDTESEGQPEASAKGDDNAPAGSASDEDGVVFVSAIVSGQIAQVRVTLTSATGANGLLDAWIDFDGDGSWNGVGERIFDSRSLSPGANILSFGVPTGLRPGPTFARFRLSRQGKLSFTGAAPDGEVEDYQVVIGASEVRLDFGDAPNPFPTTLKDDGARHFRNPDVFLGQLIDSEDDGQPTPNATGDDTPSPASQDDEDGVSFLSAATVGQDLKVEVRASTKGALDAWLDLNGNGSWADVGEQVFLSIPLSPGVNSLAIPIPSTATPGVTYMRFRFSLQGKLSFKGVAVDGEVEDYELRIIGSGANLDFGDAPEKYPTLLAQNGARHVPSNNVLLGQKVDAEPNGQPNAAATGDDLNGADEDGVKFVSSLVAGQTATVEITASTRGFLNAWVDFNANGSWADASDQIFSAKALNPGLNTLTFTVPGNVVDGVTYARFRFGLIEKLSFDGAGEIGEVEDYRVELSQGGRLDFGDAPEQYPTKLPNGARHRIVPQFFLGRRIDGEADGQPNVSATGDDINPSAADDEDGVTFPFPLEIGQPTSVQVTASISGRLNAWIDYNANGNWNDAGEQIFTNQALTGGLNSLNFVVPTSAKATSTYARFRFNRSGNLKPEGPAEEGEVEDYQIVVSNPPRNPCDPHSAKGREFWLAFPSNYTPDPANPVRLSLCITGSAETKGEISVLNEDGKPVTAGFSIPGSMTATINLPAFYDLGAANDQIAKKGIHVSATGPVTIMAMSRAKFTADAYLALPNEALGQAYLVMNYGNTHTGVPELNGTQFAVLACEDNTRVGIIPSVDTLGRAAGDLYIQTLNKGDVYQLRNEYDNPVDLSGTIVVSDKPVAVYGSHRCANIPSKNEWFCDYIVEQLLPASRAGTSFLTMPFKTRLSDTIRVLALQDGTVVTVNGTNVATIDRLKHHEFLQSTSAQITTNKPVMVAQYANSSDRDAVANSDPFMVIVPPTNMFLAEHMICVPSAADYPASFVNLIVPTSAVSSAKIDGIAVPVASFSSIVGTTFSGAQVSVSPGSHNITATGAFGSTVYGWSLYESYGYPGALFFTRNTALLDLPCGQVGPILPPILRIDTAGRVPRLTWDRGTLEHSADLRGPWNPLTNALSPFLVPSGSQRGFYRVSY